MHKIRAISKQSTVLLLMLFTLLGAQTIESAHQHAVGDITTDCVLCQTYTDTQSTAHVSLPATHIVILCDDTTLTMAPATVAVYAHLARGPPLHT